MQTISGIINLISYSASDLRLSWQECLAPNVPVSLLYAPPLDTIEIVGDASLEVKMSQETGQKIYTSTLKFVTAELIEIPNDPVFTYQDKHGSLCIIGNAKIPFAKIAYTHTNPDTPGSSNIYSYEVQYINSFPPLPLIIAD